MAKLASLTKMAESALQNALFEPMAELSETIITFLKLAITCALQVHVHTTVQLSVFNFCHFVPSLHSGCKKSNILMTFKPYYIPGTVITRPGIQLDSRTLQMPEPLSQKKASLDPFMFNQIFYTDGLNNTTLYIGYHLLKTDLRMFAANI